jgi:hypothetical protein
VLDGWGRLYIPQTIWLCLHCHASLGMHYLQLLFQQQAVVSLPPPPLVCQLDVEEDNQGKGGYKGNRWLGPNYNTHH